MTPHQKPRRKGTGLAVPLSLLAVVAVALGAYAYMDHAEQARAAREHEKRHFRDCEQCPLMARLPAGSFMMGSQKYAEHGEGPVHRVDVAEFAAGVHEVTFAEWDACVAAGGCDAYRPEDEGWGRGRRPVIHVSWDNARAYADWLSTTTGHRYRLLSESEWEYAARAGTTTPYYVDVKVPHRTDLHYGGHQTLEVGTLGANPWGLHDVAGNVWEWVQDCWHEDYDGAPATGAAWENGACDERILRGGSWNSRIWNLRSSRRMMRAAADRSNLIGFRVARTLTP